MTSPFLSSSVVSSEMAPKHRGLAGPGSCTSADLCPHLEGQLSCGPTGALDAVVLLVCPAWQLKSAELARGVL